MTDYTIYQNQPTSIKGGKIPQGVLEAFNERLACYKEEYGISQPESSRKLRITIRQIMDDCPFVGREALEAAWPTITTHYLGIGLLDTDHPEVGTAPELYLDFKI